MMTFPILQLALDAGTIGGTLPCVFNAANEEAVNTFLQGKLRYLDIFTVIHSVMERHKTITSPDWNDIYNADLWSRHHANEVLKAIRE